MNIIASINVDLLSPLPVQTVNAKQGDTARGIEFNLFDGGEPFNIPAGTYGAFRAAKPDGTYCFYDSANGQSAVSIYGNTVRVLLADQVLTADGTVNCEVNLYNAAGEKVTSFNVDIAVQASVLPDPLVSDNYVSFLTDLAQQILSAGITIVPLGFYATLAALEAAVPDPNPGDIYGVGASEPFDFYCYDIVSDAWVDMGTMAGPQGEQGEQGIPGVGIPTGGAVGQYIMKASAADYDVTWDTPAGAGDMLKSVYDTNNNGIVDNSERLGGELPSYYLPSDALNGLSSSGAVPLDITDVGTGTTISSLAVNGQSTQTGTPDLSNPVTIDSVNAAAVDVYPTGDQGSGENYPITPSITLRGVRVPSNYAAANYVDSNGDAWCCDTYDIATGILTQRIGHLVVLGTEAGNVISYQSSVQNTVRFDWTPSASTTPITPTITTPFYGVCSHASTPGTSAQVIGGNADFCVYQSSVTVNRFRLAAPSSVTDNASAKAWFAAQNTAGTPVTVDYILATPVVTQLAPISIQAYSPNTTIDADGEVSVVYNSLYGMLENIKNDLTVSKQDLITANGILKGDGNGNISAAVSGTDYQTPLTAGTDYAVPPTAVSGSGSVTVTLANNREYTYTGVTSLAMTGANVSCHGFITFGSGTPSVSSPSGFNGVAGDDITTAAASEVWEFSCERGYVVFKNWSAT